MLRGLITAAAGLAFCGSQILSSVLRWLYVSHPRLINIIQRTRRPRNEKPRGIVVSGKMRSLIYSDENIDKSIEVVVQTPKNPSTSNTSYAHSCGYRPTSGRAPMADGAPLHAPMHPDA